MFLKEIFPKYHIDEAKMDHIYWPNTSNNIRNKKKY